MPDADAYRQITYEAMNSPFGPGSAELLADRIVDALRKLRAGSAR